MYRNTFCYINLKHIRNNVKKIINKLDNYEYYMGVVKADSYGHYDNKVVKAIIEGGCNYLAVATLDEALEIRKDIKDIGILCLGVIPTNYLHFCTENNIDITISNYNYLNSIKDKNLKVHLKVNSGMNRLGMNNSNDIEKCINTINESNLTLQGIFTHMYEPDNIELTKKQEDKFEEITKNIDLSIIPMVHLGASEYSLNYPKKDYVNTTRLGIIMYNLVPNDLNLEDTFSVGSRVIEIHELNENDTVGYNGSYKVKGKERIAVVPIGYADGIIRKNTGRDVFINNKRYPIVGNICMDMLFVKVDDSVKIHDRVQVIKDNNHILEISKYLDTIPYEIICTISKRVPRVYEEED